jgi:hypothetical protein
VESETTNSGDIFRQTSITTLFKSEEPKQESHVEESIVVLSICCMIKFKRGAVFSNVIIPSTPKRKKNEPSDQYLSPKNTKREREEG